MGNGGEPDPLCTGLSRPGDEELGMVIGREKVAIVDVRACSVEGRCSLVARAGEHDS